MEKGLILCKLALKNFGNVFLLTLLPFLIKTLIFLETGNIDKKKSTGGPKKRTPEVVEEVRGLLEATPSKSIRVDMFRYKIQGEWFLHNMNDDILDVIFFIDEACFHLEGYVNLRNMRTR
ncbi:hypothetical protein BDFB_007959 [Asbolus verrucosus]|uniref:Uncharacterized protein n=1 Tax=Asbolus verrucosus TaxID=1661398 RepID=A0A482VWA5_ASBVE|nr:hypothetical protein BDFB_007959 [Asbolus verrucosus]